MNHTQHTLQSLVEDERDDPLAQRLAALQLPTPPTLIPRVLTAAMRHTPVVRRRSRPRLALAAFAIVALLLGANVGATYFAPRYAQALADVPGAGLLTTTLLQEAGVSAGDATALDLRATAAGYTIHLFGTYADSVRTTLFVRVEPQAGHAEAVIPITATLTDQFGHAYHALPAGGDPILYFEPLVWPASSVGARLTLHIDTLEPGPTAPQASAPSTKSNPTAQAVGPWEIHFTLIPSGGRDLSLPPTVQIGDTAYTFNRVEATGSILQIEWTITGGAIDRMNAVATERGQYLRGALPAHPQPGRVVPVPTPPGFEARERASYNETATAALLDPAGRQITPIWGYGHSVGPVGHPTAMIMDAWYPLSGSGSYRFQVSSTATGSLARTIAVP